MLKEDELKDAVVLIYANKQDLPNAANAAEILNKVLGGHVKDTGRQWHVQVSANMFVISRSVLKVILFVRLRPQQAEKALLKGWNGSGKPSPHKRSSGFR